MIAEVFQACKLCECGDISIPGDYGLRKFVVAGPYKIIPLKRIIRTASKTGIMNNLNKATCFAPMGGCVEVNLMLEYLVGKGCLKVPKGLLLKGPKLILLLHQAVLQNGEVIDVKSSGKGCAHGYHQMYKGL